MLCEGTITTRKKNARSCLLSGYDVRGFVSNDCRSHKLERIQRTRLFKVIADRCKRTRVCFCCGAINGPVK